MVFITMCQIFYTSRDAIAGKPVPMLTHQASSRTSAVVVDASPAALPPRARTSHRCAERENESRPRGRGAGGMARDLGGTDPPLEVRHGEVRAHRGVNPGTRLLCPLPPAAADRHLIFFTLSRKTAQKRARLASAFRPRGSGPVSLRPAARRGHDAESRGRPDLRDVVRTAQAFQVCSYCLFPYCSYSR